jgi:hypothetical protein
LLSGTSKKLEEIGSNESAYKTFFSIGGSVALLTTDLMNLGTEFNTFTGKMGSAATSSVQMTNTFAQFGKTMGPVGELIGKAISNFNRSHVCATSKCFVSSSAISALISMSDEEE